MANSNQSDNDYKRTASSSGASAAVNPGVSADVPAAPCLIPTFSDACKLVSAPYSCLVLRTHRRHVALPPMYLKKKRTGIQEELNAELLKYSNSLKGVPLAYDDIKIIGQHGNIFDDQGYIHVNIQASFVIFKPRKGEKLVGVINKIGAGHVGCLVHGCFNASVVKPAQLTPEQWRDSGLKVGGSLEFEVFQLDADVAGVLLIRGRLERSRVQELVASFSSTETQEQHSEDVPVEAASMPDSFSTEENTESPGVSKPKKKKKKKDKDRSSDMVAEDTYSTQTGETITHSVNGNGMDLDSNSNIRPKEKKQNTIKQREVDDELPSPTADLRNSDSSGYISDKGSKKRRAQNDSREDCDFPPAKKKKKIK